MVDETLLNNLIDNLNALLVLNDHMQHNLKRIYETLDKQSALLLQPQDFTDDALPLRDERQFPCFSGDDSDLELATTISLNSGSSESKQGSFTSQSDIVFAISIGPTFAHVMSPETIYLAHCHEQHDWFDHRFNSHNSLVHKLNVALAPNVIEHFPSVVTDPGIFVSYPIHIANAILLLGHIPMANKLNGDYFRRNTVLDIVTHADTLNACCQYGSTQGPFTFYETNETSTKLFQRIGMGWVVTTQAVQVSVWHKWKIKLASTTKQFSWTFLLAANCILSYFPSTHLNHFFITLIIPFAEKFSLAPRHVESPLYLLLREELATYGRNNSHAVLKNQVQISIVARLTSVFQVNVHRATTFSSILGYLAYFAPLNQGLQIHTHVFKPGMGFSILVRILLVSFYAKLGCVHDSNMIFHSYIIVDSFRSSNVVSYPSMINEFPQKGSKKEVLTLSVKMDTSSFGYIEAEHLGNHFIRHGFEKKAWIPHSISFHIDDKRQLHLVEFYLNAVMLSILDCCQQIFNSMLVDNGIEPLIQHYGCVVDFLSRGQMVLETVKLLYKIPRNVDLMILGALLKGCGSLGIIVVEQKTLNMLLTGALHCAKPINPIVATVLLIKYVKCGAIVVAFKVFNSMQTNGNLASNTMLMGPRMHGHDNNAPLDEYGVPKWDFLKHFHKAIQLYAVFLVATDPPTTFLGIGHHSPGRATTWKDIFGLLHGLLDLHLEDKVKLKGGGEPVVSVKNQVGGLHHHRQLVVASSFLAQDRLTQREEVMLLLRWKKGSLNGDRYAGGLPYMWAYFLESKDQAFENFKEFKLMVENEVESKLKMLRTDKGGELPPMCSNNIANVLTLIFMEKESYTWNKYFEDFNLNEPEWTNFSIDESLIVNSQSGNTTQTEHGEGVDTDIQEGEDPLSLVNTPSPNTHVTNSRESPVR
ncbi:hypothetical protein E3N88_08980 [Mikania micrantha]|uniref:Uncharacterized protein n=1 Tax=Mikania micrantha TaxID=192012 RepID=A0A5N6PHU8_9ASTR|nr:hypothetical protein E3N88_08980 [Mikania micrantha]